MASEKTTPEGNATSITIQAQIIYPELTFETVLPVPSPASSLYPSPPSTAISPFHWTSKRKIFTTCLSCAATLISGYASGSNNAAGPGMGLEWNVTQTTLLVGTTTYCIGFAIAPMVLAPISELKGRKPIFLLSGFIFAISQLGCALANSYAGMLVARFWTGVGSSTFSTMVGGIVADIYRAENRNTAMAIFAGVSFVGTGLGPLISGIIAFHLHWRWVFYVQAISCGTLALLSSFLFEETRENVLLSRNANALNKWYDECEKVGMIGLAGGPGENLDKARQNLRWTVTDVYRKSSLANVIRISVSRPFYLLVTEPIVFWFSLWIAFAWGVLYLSFAGIPIVFDDAYNFNSQQTGAVFTSMVVGAVLGTALNIGQEILRKKRQGPVQVPEKRLYFACVECALFPIGLLWWAWTGKPDVHWIVPSCGVCCATIGIYTIFLAVNNYTADTYHRLASSALAAQSLTRNILGGVFPLAAESMFAKLTNAGALSFLGGLALLLSLVPWALVVFGPRIRARSKIASELMDH